jgi:uncharacterized DUF497 family protein
LTRKSVFARKKKLFLSAESVIKSLEKHKIEFQRAEQVFQNKEVLIPIRIQTSPKVAEPRFGALGIDHLGRRLFSLFYHPRY